MVKPEAVKKALELISKSVANHEYFFRKLDSPEWIEPLEMAGLFSKPPPIDQVGQSFRFPVWPESRYLARMAKVSPGRVAKILETVSSVDNERIHEDIIDALLLIPAKDAGGLEAAEIKWISKTNTLFLLLPFKVMELITHLLKEGRRESGLRFTRALFALRAPEKEAEDKRRLTEEAVARFDSYEYGELLDKVVESLSASAPLEGLDFLRDALLAAIRIEIEDYAETKDDLSYSWRSSIAQESEYRSRDLKNKLVSAILELCKNALDAGKISIDSLMKRIDASVASPIVFQRIALYLFSQSPLRTDLSLSWVLDQRAVQDPRLLPEYSGFIGAMFPLLKPEEATRFLSLIDQGPDIDAIRASLRSDDQTEMPEEEVGQRVVRWKRDRLSMVAQYLPDDKKKELDEFTKSQGKARDLSRPHFEIKVGWGREPTPITEEFSAVSIGDVSGHLKARGVGSGVSASDVEDLGAELTRRVVEAPTEFSKMAGSFKGLQPIYVRSFLAGLDQALRQKAGIDWPPVIDLAEWVVQQSDKDQPSEAVRPMVDVGWSWSRKAVADVIREGLGKTSHEIPRKLDAQVARVIRILASDPDPTVEYEKQRADDFDPASLSLNTVRGKALHCSVAFAIRQRREPHEGKLEEPQRKASEVLLQETLNLLSSRLDPQVDPSATIRSVYGQWFNSLFVLDRAWAKAEAPKIFGGDDRLRLAAWDSFIVFNEVSNDVMGVLEAQYSRAVDDLSKPRKKAKLLPEDPKCRLAVHLMWPYVWGRFDPKPFEGILAKFFAQAEDRIRAFGIEVLGRGLKDATPDDLKPEQTRRLRELWSWRLAESQAKPKDHAEELEAFGWWVASGKLEEDWVLEQLLATLKLNRKIEPEMEILAELARKSASSPLLSMQCLREVVVGGGKYGYSGVSVWKDSARKILESGQKSESAEARKLALEVVERLGAMGQAQFRDLK